MSVRNHGLTDPTSRTEQHATSSVEAVQQTAPSQEHSTGKAASDGGGSAAQAAPGEKSAWRRLVDSLAERAHVETLPRLQRRISGREQVQVSHADRESELYVRSYLLIRTAVGLIGIVLPIGLVIGESVITGSVTARGSVSAYYHSPMQDFFVSGLCIVAFLLLTYMSGQPRTLDFRLSAIAGVALFFVVFFPTKRSDLQPEALLCGPRADAQPAGCSVTEAWWGEENAAAVHAVAAAVFIGSLLVICLAFAYRDSRKHRGSARTATHLFSAIAIAVAVLWVIFGPSRIFGLQPLWLGEFVATVAFGVSWFVAGHGGQLARRRPYPVP